MKRTSRINGFPLLFAIAFSAFVTIPGLCPISAQTHSGIDYGKTGDASQKLDIYMPSGGTKPYPVVVWIHGGAFKSGSRTDGNASQLAGLLNPRGVVVISIDYRLSGVAKWPAQIHDCKAAVRWVRANAATYNFDPDRIGTAGGSAGGHLASFVGVAGGIGTVTVGSTTMDLEGTVGNTSAYSSKVQAVLDMYGPTDFLKLNDVCPQNNPTVSTQDHDAAGSPESLLIGGAIQQNKDKSTLAHPIHFVSSDDPPFLILHGNRDNLIVVCQSNMFAAALRTAFALNRTECQFLQFASQGHGFNVSYSPDTIVAFFTRNLINKIPARTRNIEAAPSFRPSIRASHNSLIISVDNPAHLLVTNTLGRTVFSRPLNSRQKDHSIDLTIMGRGLLLCMLKSDKNGIAEVKQVLIR